MQTLRTTTDSFWAWLLVDPSDGFERVVRRWRQLDRDAIAGAHISPRDDDGHHPRLADQTPLGVAVHCRLHQPVGEPVELHARVAQPGDLDDGVGSEPQAGAARHTEQVDTSGGDVLPHVSRPDLEPDAAELVVELGMNEVDLPEVGPGRITAYPRSVLHGCAEVRVAFYTEPGHKGDGFSGWLGEAVFIVAAH